MTKAELIRKIAKMNGVQDSEARMFFELLLKNISETITPGEAVKIEDLGTFRLQRGIGASSAETIQTGTLSQISGDFIVFSSLVKEGYKAGTKTTKIVFDVPAAESEEFYPVDSYFTLSIGKPTIPLGEKSTSEYLVPPAGHELRKLLESKAVKLIQSSEILRDLPTEEEYLVFGEHVVEEGERIIDEEKHDSDEKEKVLPAETRADELSWDFGKDIDRQIVEESILDFEVDESELEEFPKNHKEKKLSWDFGTEKSEEESSLEETVEENILAGEDKKYKRVEQLEAELEEEIETAKTDEVDKTSEQETPDFVEESLLINGFTQVKPKATRVILEEGGEGLKSEDDLGEEEYDFDSDIEETEEEFTESFSTEEEMDTVENVQIEKISIKKESRRMEDRHRNSSSWIWIAASIIALAGIIFILYWSSQREPSKPSAEETPAAAKDTSKVVDGQIIERDYNLPVTYPYSKEVSPTEQAPTKVKESTKPLVTEKAVKPSAKQPASIGGSKIDIKEGSGSAKPVHGNIFKEDKFYSVQVSSWRSPNKAQQEAQKLNRRGYNSFILKVYIPQLKSTWYRVRIGGINSLEEAEKLSNQLK